MAHRIANGMANAMALALLQHMAHSTPLHSTTGVALICGVCGDYQIQSHGDLGDWLWSHEHVSSDAPRRTDPVVIA